MSAVTCHWSRKRLPECRGLLNVFNFNYNRYYWSRILRKTTINHMHLVRRRKTIRSKHPLRIYSTITYTNAHADGRHLAASKLKHTLTANTILCYHHTRNSVPIKLQYSLSELYLIMVPKNIFLVIKWS